MPNLYLISQDHYNSYDTYDSAVVVARSAEHARRIHPCDTAEKKFEDSPNYPCWATKPEQITARYIGRARVGLRAGTVICASFNAG